MKLGEVVLHSKEAVAERLERCSAKLLSTEGRKKKYQHSNGTKHVVVTDQSHPGTTKFLLEEYDARCDCGF